MIARDMENKIGQGAGLVTDAPETSVRDCVKAYTRRFKSGSLRENIGKKAIPTLNKIAMSK